jgi:hypothetical protein
MLYQLENGNWIDPADISRIKADPGCGHPSPDPGSRPPSVLIEIRGTGCFEIVPFSSFEEACSYRDRIGRDVNAAMMRSGLAIVKHEANP